MYNVLLISMCRGSWLLEHVVNNSLPAQTKSNDHIYIFLTL